MKRRNHLILKFYCRLDHILYNLLLMDEGSILLKKLLLLKNNNIVDKM